MTKTIFHVDMDAFFVSVEEVLNPSLRGKPVIVGGDPNGRGVVSAASYRAREYGVRSAMPMGEAKRLCPKAVFLRGSHHLYAEFSDRVMNTLERYTPVIEKVSVDEAYIDLTGCERLYRTDPATIAQRIVRDIRGQVGIPASIGIGSSRLIAKIASSAAKPKGILWIRPGYEACFLRPMPIGRMPGVGPTTERACRRMGIRAIGDLLRFDPKLLERVFGKYGPVLARKARGEDTREITPGGRTPKNRSVSREVTYATDTEDPERLKATLSYLSESVGRRVRKAGFVFKNVTVKVRYSDFKTCTRSRAFLATSDDTGLIFRSACELVDQVLATRRGRIRLVGVGVATAGPAEQLDLFDSRARRPSPIHRPMDEVRDRYGFESALLARSSLYAADRARRKERLSAAMTLSGVKALAGKG